MDKLVADLLEIEHIAIESMNAFEAEKAAHAQHISEEIARRTLEIKRKADKDLQLHKQEAEADTQSQLEDIERKHQQSAARIKTLFEKNAASWQKEWVARILHPAS